MPTTPKSAFPHNHQHQNSQINTAQKSSSNMNGRYRKDIGEKTKEKKNKGKRIKWKEIKKK